MKLSEIQHRKLITKEELIEIIQLLKNDYNLNIDLYIPFNDESRELVLRLKDYVFLYEGLIQLWQDLKKIVIASVQYEEALKHK